MKTTTAHGKRTQDKQWVVPTAPFEQQQRLFADVVQGVYVKVRDDLDYMLKDVRASHGGLLQEIRTKGEATVSVSKYHDKSANMMRHRLIKLRAVGPNLVDARMGRKLLDPMGLGMVFEECNPAGEAYYPAPIPAGSQFVEMPETPLALQLQAKEAELEQMKAQIEMLMREREKPAPVLEIEKESAANVEALEAEQAASLAALEAEVSPFAAPAEPAPKPKPKRKHAIRRKKPKPAAATAAPEE